MKRRDTEELINIGRIGSSVGLRGEVRVTLHASDSGNLKEGKVLLLKHAGKRHTGSAGAAGTSSADSMRQVSRNPGGADSLHHTTHNSGGARDRQIELKCTGVRLQKDKPVIKLEGITDRNMADELRGMEIYIREDQLEELPEGQHYVRDIIGYKVIDLASGTEIGRLKDVIQNTAQNILEVERYAVSGENEPGADSTDDAGKRAGSVSKTVLIPAVDAFMRCIDDEREVIEVELIPGFL